MALHIRKATKAQKPLRLLISGQTASGKTYSSLLLANGMKENAKILVFDTESGRASLKSGKFNFDVVTWDNNEMGKPVSYLDYIEVIKLAEKEGYDVLILDSITPEWEELKDRHSKMTGNSFANWGVIKPLHQKFIDEILNSKIHIICTARSKMEYVLEETVNKFGKTVQTPTLKGLGTQQQNDLPYFMDFIFNIVDRQHNTEAEKDETEIYLNKGYFTINEVVGKNIVNWLNDGEIIQPETKEPLKVVTGNKEEEKIQAGQVANLKIELKDLPELEKQVKQEFNIESFKDVPVSQWTAIKKRITELKKEAA